MSTGTSLNRAHGSVYLGVAVTMMVASGGLLAGHYMMSADDVVPTAQAAKIDRAEQRAAMESFERALDSHLDSAVEVRIGERSVAIPLRQLGVTTDRAELARMIDEAADVAELGGPDGLDSALSAAGALPLSVERERALARLAEFKASHDGAPRNARMDLESRTIHREQAGQSIDVLSSLVAIERAARTGADEVVLSTVAVPAEVSVGDLGIDDISEVLASFETKFSTADFSRNYNLELAASKLNGFVMQPGAEFSFNEVVGARTEKEGYKIAGVITAGEMVDGLAGGTCQISSTLHGAAFFAGIGIVESLPHSRPSTYVTMGLDATVVYPHVDLKLRNDYDFPVAIHFKVTRGRSIVEILGRERPFDEIAFERKVVEELEFDTITREDEAMPVGTMRVDQYGFYGYKLERLRKFYKDGKMVKRDRWRLRYAPVTEYA
ncbi:MAG: VanW family protein, partial [Myxococcota bacterium]